MLLGAHVSPAGGPARAVDRGVERGARTVLAPASGWLLVALYRLFPGEAQRRMAGMTEPA